MSERESDSGRGRLFVVATPIGNLEDASPRLVKVLSEVDGIAAEDTRRTRVLLSHFGISTPLRSYHDHNESRVAGELLKRIRSGEDIALVSDAGTPLIADPGYRIVCACAEAGADVVSVPGPCAVTAALSVAGLPPHPFYFAGYLPRRSAARRKRIAQLAELDCTLVFYESPHRIAAALEDLREVLGERRAAVARELTKLHEEILRGTLGELSETAGRSPLRGEIVVIVAPPGRHEATAAGAGDTGRG